MDPKTTDPQGTEDTAPQGAADTTPQGDAGAPQGDDAEKVKAEARKWEQRAKKDAQALVDLKDQIAKMLSPEQVADKDAALATAQAELAKAQSEALKYRVALSEGLPIDLADRLRGDTEEELKKDAETLKGMVKPPAPPGLDGKKAQGTTTPEGKADLNALLRQRLSAG